MGIDKIWTLLVFVLCGVPTFAQNDTTSFVELDFFYGELPEEKMHIHDKELVIVHLLFREPQDAYLPKEQKHQFQKQLISLLSFSTIDTLCFDSFDSDVEISHLLINCHNVKILSILVNGKLTLKNNSRIITDAKCVETLRFYAVESEIDLAVLDKFNVEEIDFDGDSFPAFRHRSTSVIRIRTVHSGKQSQKIKLIEKFPNVLSLDFNHSQPEKSARSKYGNRPVPVKDRL